MSVNEQIRSLWNSAQAHAKQSPDGFTEAEICNVYNHLRNAAKEENPDVDEQLWPGELQPGGPGGRFQVTWANLEALARQLFSLARSG